VVKVLCYKLEDYVFETRGGEFFSIYLILQAALGPGVHSAFTILSTRSRKLTMFLGSKLSAGV
jgi:hypothetical protein